MVNPQPGTRLWPTFVQPDDEFSNQIFDPFTATASGGTRTAFANNIIPKDRIYAVLWTPYVNPRNSTFGFINQDRNNPRDVQLGLRFTFCRRVASREPRVASRV
jgi:hypothetical protein